MSWDNTELPWASFVKLAQSTGPKLLIGILTVAIVLRLVVSKCKQVSLSNVPTYGYKFKQEPTTVLQMRFVTGAKSIIAGGYRKFKGSPFIVRRFDIDYNILPISYLSEIGWVSPSILSSKIATAQNMLYEWTDLHFLHRSSLHARVMKIELTPRLSKYLAWASEEIEYGWNEDVPHSDDWIEADIQEVTRKLVARMSARIFLGKPGCRDKEWVRVSIDYSIDAFTTAFLLRMFPTWMRPALAHFLPSRYRLKSHRKKAEEVVKAAMEKHIDALPEEERGGAFEEERSLLDWMIDNATAEEKEPREMANRLCVMSLASIHTTSTNTSAFLYELCAHPEWIPVLREEIEQVQEQTRDEKERDFRLWHPRLEKMDSFLLECFRVHPPVLLNPQRVALQSYTLKNGTHIPKGCRIAFANGEHQMDPAITPNPDAFDPMRSYNKRQASADAYPRHQAVLTDIDNNLTFGYGNQACPGRFLGVAEIKMLLTRLLTEFDFKYPEGKTLPRTLTADENVFMEPSARLMMRKRRI